MTSSDRAGAAAASPNVSAVRPGPSSAGPVVNSEGEAPARVIARGPVKPVSGGILNGKAMTLPAPIYPEVARRARTTGMVTVEVIVDVTGRVISAKAVDGPTMLQAAAETAARQARFSPTLLSGQPVRVSGQIAYNFTLK
jgi:protein TonB